MEHKETSNLYTQSTHREKPVLFMKDSECCGCSACYSACPVNAIEMKSDDKGFLYPTIDASICINCNYCLHVCAFKTVNKSHSKDTLVFAARTKNEDVLRDSSSGGVFTEITNYFLENGWAVICSIYNYKYMEMEYHLVLTKVERDAARGSKYVQSFPNNIFEQAFNWLKSNPSKNLLFVGLGCVADGFRSFAEMKRIIDRVYIVDLICNGNPSIKIWKDYVLELERNNTGKVCTLNFKDKRNGWLNPLAIANINGEEHSIRGYTKLFYSQLILRDSCYSCPYTKTHRKTDITIGDYWGIETTIPDFYHPMGNSLLLIHSEKGKQLFDTIKFNFEYCSTDLEKCLQPRLIEPAEKPFTRRLFWMDYQNRGIKYVVHKYRDRKWITLLIQYKKRVKRVVRKLLIILAKIK